jgi:hypothetical protein
MGSRDDSNSVLDAIAKVAASSSELAKLEAPEW